MAACQRGPADGLVAVSSGAGGMGLLPAQTRSSADALKCSDREMLLGYSNTSGKP